MRRYKRFDDGKERTPVLFFVGAFALLTATLALVFIKFNSSQPKEQPVVARQIKIDPVLKPLTPAPAAAQYDKKINEIVTVLTEELKKIWGTREDQQWEQRVREKSSSVEAISFIEGTEKEVLAQRVPALRKEAHLTLVVQLSSLRQGLQKGQIDTVEENLVKIEHTLEL